MTIRDKNKLISPYLKLGLGIPSLLPLTDLASSELAIRKIV